ncbi:CatA-like O-acetyltransferase [Aquimarina sp. W85]|uniref:CatA-like O-acetyltransferase n=1 Tax=Aquimarina rhodophyticola TaxID=3342246 RepID=UPI00366EBA11
MNRNLLDIEHWNRKEHYEFFSSFDEPFFGIVTEVDYTIGYKIAKEMDTSQFLYYLFCSLKAVNDTEAFRYRIDNGKLYEYNQIHASSTIGRDDHTFGFSFIEFCADFKKFERKANHEIEEVKNSKGLRFNEDAKRLDTIHYSSIPWYNISGLTHARNYSHKDSIPKISFGKYRKEGTKTILPVAVYVHHGLMDGYHIGVYLDKFQMTLNKPNISDL